MARPGNLPSHEASELWRMVGSLEWVSPDQKATLALTAIEQAGMKQAESYRSALLWAAGRLASRSPVYGPLNTVVSTQRAAEILAKMLSKRTQENAVEQATRQLAVTQIVLKTGDRYRDVPDKVRAEVLDWLAEHDVPERFRKSVEEGGALQHATMKTLCLENRCRWEFVWCGN